jgi:hypothetical protein
MVSSRIRSFRKKKPREQKAATTPPRKRGRKFSGLPTMEVQVKSGCTVAEKAEVLAWIAAMGYTSESACIRALIIEPAHIYAESSRSPTTLSPA